MMRESHDRAEGTQPCLRVEAPESHPPDSYTPEAHSSYSPKHNNSDHYSEKWKVFLLHRPATGEGAMSMSFVARRG